MPPAKSRVHRQLEQYATHDGAVSIAEQRKRHRSKMSGLEGGEAPASEAPIAPPAPAAEAATERLQLCDSLLSHMRTAGIRKLSGTQQRIVRAIVESQRDAHIVSPKTHERRSALAIGVSQLLHADHSLHALVVLDTENAAEGMVQNFGVLGTSPTAITGGVDHPRISHVCLGSFKALLGSHPTTFSRFHLVCIDAPEEIEDAPKRVRELLARVGRPVKVIVLSSAINATTPAVLDVVRSAHSTPTANPGGSPKLRAKDAAAVAPPLERRKLQVHTIKLSGVERLHALNALLNANPTGRLIVVVSGSVECSRLYVDVLYALQSPLSVVLGDSVESVRTFARTPRPSPTAPSSVLFTHAHAGDLQRYGVFDAPLHIICVMDPPQDIRALLCAIAPPPSKDKTSATALQRTVVVFQEHAFAAANQNWMRSVAAASDIALDLQPLPPLPASKALLSVQKLKGLMKKLFAVHHDAFLAYRSYMLHISQLPHTVFNVRDLDPDTVASGFGLEVAPPLDLRTGDTQFRAKENVYKYAVKRARLENIEAKARLQAMPLEHDSSDADE